MPWELDVTVLLVVGAVFVTWLAMWDAVPRLLDEWNPTATPFGAVFNTDALFGAHFIAVAALTVLSLQRTRTWTGRAGVVAIILASGLGIELAQVLFTAYRGFEEIDVAANVYGTIAGTTIVRLAAHSLAAGWP